MKYSSTRGRSEAISVSRAIIRGIAEDRGLYVPREIPQLSWDWMEMAKLEYTEVVQRVLAPYLPEFTAEELADCVGKAYGGTFAHEQVALVGAGGVHFLELFHGRTAA